MNLEKENLRQDRTVKSGLTFHIPKSLLQVKSIIEEKIVRIVESENKPDVIPFLEMRINNTSEVYKMAKSYVSDVEKGKRSFGFVSLKTEGNDLNIAAIASCFSYSRNNSPVLIIVKDLSDTKWTKYVKGFTQGALGSWSTVEWGNLCLIDYRELLSGENNKGLDFKLIYAEFDAIFWSMPTTTSENTLKEVSIDVLRSLDSIAITLQPGKITATEVKDIERSYKTLGIPLKGILQEGCTK